MPPAEEALSLRRLLHLLGLPAETAESWMVQGATFPMQQGANPLLDQPLPAVGPWGDPGISVRMTPNLQPLTQSVPTQTPVVPVIPLMPPSPGFAPAAFARPAVVNDDQALHMLGIYGSDWQSLLAMETQLASVRKQLGAIQGQLQSLNRDLNPDEKLVADNQDKKDWQDARRWLRDSLATVSRWIRDHDIGMVSAAGNRNRFEQVYREHVVPNKPFPGIAASRSGLRATPQDGSEPADPDAVGPSERQSRRREPCPANPQPHQRQSRKAKEKRGSQACRSLTYGFALIFSPPTRRHSPVAASKILSPVRNGNDVDIKLSVIHRHIDLLIRKHDATRIDGLCPSLLLEKRSSRGSQIPSNLHIPAFPCPNHVVT